MQATLDNKKIFIVVPAFNESGIIRKVVEELVAQQYSVVVVDDGSSTLIVRELKTLPGIFVLRHRVNLGQGAALQTGIQFALKKGAEAIITFDGDGQHSATDIPAMLEPVLHDESDIVLASRFIREGSSNVTRSRRSVLKAGRLVNYFFTGLYLTDSHNGLRAMNRRAAERMQLKENRMAHASEILFNIRKHRLRYQEVPATVLYTAYSKKKGQSALNSVRILFDLVLHKLFE